MTELSRRRLWLAGKILLAVLIVLGVAQQFSRILSQDDFATTTVNINFIWLLPAGVLYFLGQCCWAAFWLRLLKAEGVKVTWYVGYRAYFVSQFGKYIPGKVMVILIRVGLLRVSSGNPLAVAVTATYETLVSMASGALLGVLLLPYLGVFPVSISGKTTGLLAVAGLPVALAILNKLVVRIAVKNREPNAAPLPTPSLALLSQGFVHGICGWSLLGLSLSCVVESVGMNGRSLTDSFPADLGSVSLAYVLGFVVLVAPGGFGVREFVLQETLTPRFLPVIDSHAAGVVAVIVALLLRLSWTITELIVALALYGFRPRQTDSELKKADPLNGLPDRSTT